MKAVTFIHTADVHIGAQASYLGSRGESRRSEVLLSFRRIIEYCGNEKIPLLLIAGDLFDSNAVEQYFIDEVFRLFESIPDTVIVFAAGNHDPLSGDSPFLNRTLPDNLIVLPESDTAVTLPELGVRICGSSMSNVYADAEPVFKTDIPDDDMINIMVLHGDAENAGSLYRSVSKDFISGSGMDYVALGHIHRATDILYAGKTAYAYCGCPDGQGFDESGEKGFYRITLSKSGVSAQLLSCAARRHCVCDIDITGITGHSQICGCVLTTLKEKYGDDYARNLYKITLCGSIPEQFTLRTDEIRCELEPLLYYVKVKSRVKIAVDYAMLAKERSLKGLFVKNMLERINASGPQERAVLEQALQLGFCAFESEVSYDNN